MKNHGQKFINKMKNKLTETSAAKTLQSQGENFIMVYHRMHALQT